MVTNTNAPAFDFGSITAAKPDVIFTSGYHGQSSKHAWIVAPKKSDQTIKSGMVACLVYNTGETRDEWVAGLTAGKTPCIILQNESAEDVGGSGGQIAGIPLSDDFTFYTAWYVTGTIGNWTTGAQVSAALAGSEHAGKFKIAEAGERILGTVHVGHYGAMVDIAQTAPANGVATDGDGKILVAHIKAHDLNGVLKA